MQLKSGLVALSVMATLVLSGGTTAEAKSESTDKKEVKKVVVTVKSGDTLSAIADKHETSYIRLFNANEAISHPDIIDVGDKVRIPRADEKLKDRLSDVSAEVQSAVLTGAANSSYSNSQVQQTVRGSSAGNTYAYGWCTWYAKEMRPDLPNNLGNGGEWTANAAAQGIPTGNQAQAGAVAEIPGHVAYVESVSADRTMMTISEMGWNYQQGQYNKRTVSTSGWSFIYRR
jgi:surface antigen